MLSGMDGFSRVDAFDAHQLQESSRNINPHPSGFAFPRLGLEINRIKDRLFSVRAVKGD